jgi:hypothetical protein
MTLSLCGEGREGSGAAELFWHFLKGPHYGPEADLARTGSRENRQDRYRPNMEIAHTAK